jgi:hypothetical protein
LNFAKFKLQVVIGHECISKLFFEFKRFFGKEIVLPFEPLFFFFHDSDGGGVKSESLKLTGTCGVLGLDHVVSVGR